MPTLAELLGQVREMKQEPALEQLGAEASKNRLAQQQLQRQMQSLQDLKQQYPDANVNVEGVSVGTPASLVNIGDVARVEEMKANRAARLQAQQDRRLAEFEKSTEGLRDILTGVQALEAETAPEPGQGGIFTNPEAKLKSRSGTVGAISSAVQGIPVLEQAGKFAQSVAAPTEVAMMQQLANQLLRESAGLSQTQSEAVRTAVALGNTPGASEQDVRRAYQRLVSIAKERAAQKRGVLRPEDYEVAKQRGMVMPEDFDPYLGGATRTPAQAKPMSFQEWKAKKRQGQ